MSNNLQGKVQFWLKPPKLLYRFPIDAILLKQFQEIPSELNKGFDQEESAWSFPITMIPKLKDYLPIPITIITEYEKYCQKIKEEREKTDLLIEISPSICHITYQKTNKFDYNLIDQACSFTVPNAKYSQAFKAGTWDGRYRLYNDDTHTFPTGLLPTVTDYLDLELYTYTLKYCYEPPRLHQFRWELAKYIEFRDFQTEAIQVALNSKRGILQIATGGGKTILASGLIQEFGVKTLFLCHTKDLLYQNYNVFVEMFPKTKIGIIGDGRCELGDIVVATIQTIAPKIVENTEVIGDYNYDIEQEYEEEDIILMKEEKPTNIDNFLVEKLLKETQLLIIDESQHVPARTFYKIAMKCQSPYKFGLSATPFRDDGFDMKIEAGLGRIIYKLTASELIKRGYLVQPTIKYIPVPPESYPRQATYASVYSKYIVNNEFRNRVISQVAHDHAKKGKQIMILVKQLRHVKLLHDLMPDAIFIQGDMDGKERKIILDNFREKKFQILIATTLADEGLDIPTLDVLILAGSGKSSTKALQRIGRVIRLSDICPKCGSIKVLIKNISSVCKCKCGNQWNYKGKTEAIIYDFIDNTKWLYDHYLKRKTIYEMESEFKFMRCNIKFE